MSELCLTCGQQLPDEPVRMTEEAETSAPGNGPAVREETSHADS